MAIQVNMLEAKTNLSALIARVLEGERVTIARAGTPVVDLIVHQPVTLRFGTMPELDVDESLFDGVDPEINELFYGPQE